MTDRNHNQTEKLVYLIQHGEAKTEAEDPARSLTDEGQQMVEQVAAWAARAGVKVDQIRHSGKRRAEQTAAIFAQHLQPPDGVTAVVGLAPNDDVYPVAEALGGETGTVMLVGHLPFMSRLAGFLLANDPDRPVIRFRMGGLVGVVREAGHWSIVCVVPPDLAA